MSLSVSEREHEQHENVVADDVAVAVALLRSPKLCRDDADVGAEDPSPSLSLKGARQPPPHLRQQPQYVQTKAGAAPAAKAPIMQPTAMPTMAQGESAAEEVVEEGSSGDRVGTDVMAGAVVVIVVPVVVVVGVRVVEVAVAVFEAGITAADPEDADSDEEPSEPSPSASAGATTRKDSVDMSQRRPAGVNKKMSCPEREPHRSSRVRAL